jgi:hypothetical protein
VLTRFPKRTVASNAVFVVLVGCVLASILLLYAQVSWLPQLAEAGYGDSYILYDVLRFQKTGIIYRDLSQPPYVPAQYSPGVYALFALAVSLSGWSNPFVGPRLIVVASFVCCAVLAASIARALIAERSAWVWGLLLACSIRSTWDWVLQLRGDLPGICFALLAIRLLLSSQRWAVPLAGVCAGLALQFKFTFVAALGAGMVWLLVQRRWNDLGRFVIPGVILAVGPYLLVYLRERRIFAQIFALSPGLMEVEGWRSLVLAAINEMVVLLGLIALPGSGFLQRPGWLLLILFVMMSSAVAAVTDLQAGGNINYFFEALFAMVPLAAAGVLRLISPANRRIGVTALIGALLLVLYARPRALDLYDQRAVFVNHSDDIRSRNRLFRLAETTLRGQRILSTVPRLALVDSEPVLTEPYLFAYLIRLGKIDPTPLLNQVLDGSFDVVITPGNAAENWRGVPHVAPILAKAIDATYRPQCQMLGSILHLPKQPHPGSDALAAMLARAHCQRID